MKKKDEVFSKFQYFKALVENQIGKKIKALRSNNCVKYTSNAFKEFCAKEGIKSRLTTPYDPQQNMVKQHKSMAIVGAVKAILHD